MRSGRGFVVLAVAPILCAALLCACAFDSTGVDYDDAAPVVIVDAATIDAATVDAVTIDATPPNTTLAVGDMRLVFAELANQQVQSFRWSHADGGWTQEQPTPALGGTPRWTINKVSRDGRGVELIAALSQSATDHSLHLLRWLDTEWSSEWVFTSPVIEGDKRGFDVEFESGSGDALVVYANGGHTPAYRTLVDSVWSPAATLPLNDGPGANPDPNSEEVLWIELESRPGSDEIALAYADANEDLVALIWDGSGWVIDSTITLETALKWNDATGVVSNRAFDLAYEAVSGGLVVAWGARNQRDFNYAIRKPVTGQWFPTNEHVANVINGDSHFIELRSLPTGDHIAGGFYDLGDGTERLGLGVWDGEQWQDTGELDSQMLDVNDTATGDFPGAVGWLTSTGTGVAIYPDNQAGTMDWVRWDDGSGWSPQTDIAFLTKGLTESVRLEATPDGEQILVVISDNNLRLFATVYDGTWQLSNLGAPLTTSIASVQTVPFSLAARQR
jgi:hypothetical protein